MQSKIPNFLYNLLINQYNEDIAEKIIDGYSKVRPVTLRVNLLKSNKQEIINVFNENNIIFREVPWYKDAFIIQDVREEEIKKLNIYNEGKIYLQSLSSMIPPIVVNPKENENILDMAAAPGGKTTQMASISNNKSMITACEKNKIRADRLKYNLEKQGAGRVNVLVEDARKLSDFFSFDKILLDAPCSGSGTLTTRNDSIEKYFSEELVMRSVKFQEELLLKALKIVKSGGEIIYSTCSILKQENENVLRNVQKKINFEIVPIENDFKNKIPLLPTSIEGTVCVLPTEEYEGFFVAKIRKK